MAAVASPLTLLREYVVALRALLAGDRVTAEGRHVRLDGVALDHPPQQPLPVQVGGAGPKTLRLAGEVGDGTVLGSGAITSVVVQPTSGEQDLEGLPPDARERRPTGAGGRLTDRPSHSFSGR